MKEREMAKITEIAPDIYRISTYLPEAELQFNQFLVKDEDPVLCHAGLASMFPEVHEAVATILDPSSIRWIFSSHFEADECGGLNRWLKEAPRAEPMSSHVAAAVSLNDYADVPPRALHHDDLIETGNHRFRFLRTPHLPHGWDAGMLYEETERTLLCSDLFQHNGDVEPITEADIVERARGALIKYQTNSLADVMPFTSHTKQLLHDLAALKPKTLATMHGSTYIGDGEGALNELGLVMKRVMGEA
jgi:flavorubredoxin